MSTCILSEKGSSDSSCTFEMKSTGLSLFNGTNSFLSRTAQAGSRTNFFTTQVRVFFDLIPFSSGVYIQSRVKYPGAKDDKEGKYVRIEIFYRGKDKGLTRIYYSVPNEK